MWVCVVIIVRRFILLRCIIVWRLAARRRVPKIARIANRCSRGCDECARRRSIIVAAARQGSLCATDSVASTATPASRAVAVGRPATSPLQNRCPYEPHPLHKVALHCAHGHRPAHRLQRYKGAVITRTRVAVRAAPRRRRCCNHPHRFHQAKSFINNVLALLCMCGVEGARTVIMRNCKRSHGSCGAASARRAEHADEGVGDAMRNARRAALSTEVLGVRGRGRGTEAQLVSKPWRVKSAADQQERRLPVERGAAACAIACGPSCRADGWVIP